MPKATTNKAPTDALLPMKNTPAEPYMDQIVSGQKTHEFRKYLLKPSITCIWFYLSAPTSSIKYVCEIEPGRGRTPALPLDGIGNAEFNEGRDGFEGYEWAYRVLSVWELREPIALEEMRRRYGMKGAPRGLQYLPEAIAERVDWRAQRRVR